MGELEKRLEALANRGNLQEARVVRYSRLSGILSRTLPNSKLQPYKLLTTKGLRTNLYTTLSLAGNIVSNGAILARLFIGTLKGIAFEWFMKLSEDLSRTRVIWRSFSSPISSKMIRRLSCQLSWQRGNGKESQLKYLWRDFRIWHSDVLAV